MGWDFATGLSRVNATKLVLKPDLGDRVGARRRIITLMAQLEIPDKPGFGEEEQMNNVLFTPPLSIETANTAKYSVSCYVLNASSSPRSGTLQIVNLDGTPISTASYISVAPGGGTGIQVQTFQNSAPVTLVYGKITVDDKPDSIRANLVLADAKGDTLVSLDAR